MIGVCHRDIKPHNILVDPNSNKVVMCDFGSAKKLVKGEPNISYICSRYFISIKILDVIELLNLYLEQPIIQIKLMFGLQDV